MKKQLMAGIAIASMGLSSTVYAEEQVSPIEPNKPSEKQSDATKKVTEADVKQSEAALVKSQKEVEQQESVVAEAEKGKTEAELAVTNAELAVTEAETLVEQATPETVATVKSDIATLEENLVKAETAIVDAQNNLSQAEVAVVKQEAVIAEVSKEKVSKDQAVALAEAEVAKAQGILDGTNQASVIKEAEDAQQALTKAETDLATAEADLLKAQEADAKRAEVLSRLEAERLALSQQESEGALTLKAAQEETLKTKQALEKAQIDLTKALNAKQALNVITLSEEYVSALRTYSDLSQTAEVRRKAEEQLDKLSSLLSKQHHYQSNPDDDHKTRYDLNHLPENVLQDLALFTSDLLNQIRQQVGTPLTAVTPSSIAFADKVTDKAVEKQWNTLTQDHHEAGITSVAREYNLFGSDKESNYFESWVQLTNMSGTSYKVPDLTVPQLKEKIYQSIKEMLFPSFVKEWLHASTLAGTRVSLIGSEDRIKKTYVSVDVTRIDNASGMHFYTIDDVMLAGSIGFDTNEITNPYNSQKVLDAYGQAKSNHDVANVAYETQKEKQESISKAHSKLLERLETVTGELSQVKATPMRTSLATEQVTKAQTNVRQANQRHIKAQEAVKALSADVKEKQKALEEAKKVLVVKQVDKDKVLARLNKEQAVLSTLTQEVEAKKVALSQAKQVKSTLDTQLEVKKDYLKQLSNAPELLKEAQSNLEKAKQTLLDKVAVLEKEVAVLKTLQEEHASLAAQHEKVIKAYQDLLKAKQEAELLRQQKELDHAVPKVNSQGHVVAYTAQAVKPENKQAHHKLPKTGETVSWLASFGTLLSGFSLVHFKRRKK